jgi:EAL domain-containing protein (putative c-di-GMP-specific phosphodiesterase class I)/DNA-binding NarL/FixJ family response regulator
MPAAPPTTVLVVDDEPFMLGLLRRALGQLGVSSISTHDNAHAALRELEVAQELPDLIMMDLNMPGMDGVEFIRRLADQHYTGALILVSGEDQHVLESIDKLIRAHGIHSLGHLRKPFDAKALAARIENWASIGGGMAHVERKPVRADELRAAISDGALINHYQPIVKVSSGEVVGVAALPRWPVDDGTTLYPEQFLGVAERNGLTAELTHTLMSAAFAQAREWHDDGMALQLAAEVPISCMIRLGFPDTLVNQTAVAGVPPDSVVLEVRESQIMANLSNELDVFNRLRLKRFHLTVNEFGAGHATLTRLRDIPFDGLKIHRSFVHGAAANDKLRAIYSAGLAMGKALHMNVYAEGLQERADWELLRRTGCDLAQGPLIADPMPGEEVADWAADWQARRRARVPSRT